jgi:hypothetical protein
LDLKKEYRNVKKILNLFEDTGVLPSRLLGAIQMMKDA